MQGIKQLEQETFWQIYDGRLKEDFPESEIRRRENFQRLWDLGCYEVLGYYDEDTLTGYAFYITLKDMKVVFGDYIAVHKTKRGNGSGSDFQNEVLKYFSSYDYLVFEVEDPEYAIDEADWQLRKRRITFYERLGAYNCKISTMVLGDNYQIFAFSTTGNGQEKSMDKKKETMDWYEIIKKIYELTFPNQETWKQIEIIRR